MLIHHVQLSSEVLCSRDGNGVDDDCVRDKHGLFLPRISDDDLLFIEEKLRDVVNWEG